MKFSRAVASIIDCEVFGSYGFALRPWSCWDRWLRSQVLEVVRAYGSALLLWSFL